MARIRKLVTALCGVSACLFVGCRSLVDRSAFFPTRGPVLDAATLPADTSHRFLPVKGSENAEVYVVRVEAASHVVVYFHGNAGNIALRVPELRELARRTSCTVVGLGYRGYGASDGRASEKSIYADGAAARAFVEAELGFPAERIVLVGRSLGTTVAVRVASEHAVGGVVLITPLTSGRDMAKAIGMGALAWAAGDAFDNLGRIEKVDAPLLIVHGDADEVVPYAMGERLFSAAREPKRFVALPGARHNDLEHTHSEVYWGAIAAFVAGLEATGDDS
jgi:pimeloyl-ACP methyl ester carboxylesterase